MSQKFEFEPFYQILAWQLKVFTDVEYILEVTDAFPSFKTKFLKKIFMAQWECEGGAKSNNPGSSPLAAKISLVLVFH